VIVDLARMRRAALADEREQRVRSFSARSGPRAAAVGGHACLRPRVHQRVDLARDEAVGDEKILLDVERRVEALEVAGAITLHPVAQRQVLCACRRADGVGLDEAHLLDRAFQAGGHEQAAVDSEGPEVGKRDGHRPIVFLRLSIPGVPVRPPCRAESSGTNPQGDRT
jgi:hypothetical protein